MHQSERGLFELRRGCPLLISSEYGTGKRHVLFTAVEGLDGRNLDELRALGEGGPRPVVAPLRAEARGVGSDGLTRRYVHAEVHRAGHWLRGMLQGALPRG